MGVKIQLPIDVKVNNMGSICLKMKRG